MKLQHRSGLFVSDEGQYYLEYTEPPYNLVCKYLNSYPEVDITHICLKREVDKNIEDGQWVEFFADGYLISSSPIKNIEVN